MFLENLFEAPQHKVVVIYPGRFSPFHKGHKSVYDSLVKRFGVDNVWIATSDKVEPPRSPFSFADKLEMMKLAGIDPLRVLQTTQPYRVPEFMAKLDASKVVLIFAISEKDMAEDPRFKFGVKKDGSPTYLQPFPGDVSKCEMADKHGYLTTVPTVEFTVMGQPMKSASAFRANFAKADPKTKKAMATDLFGKLNTSVFNLMKGKITEDIEVSDAVHFHDTLNPKLWDDEQTLNPIVADHLHDIAVFFIKTLSVEELDVVDITISGSNAAYTYTEHSDIDLHVIINVPEDDQPLMRSLVDAKKSLFNNKHDITIKGQPVELYVQFAGQPHTSAGIYSLRKGEWEKIPQKVRANISDADVKSKTKFLIKAINLAINTDNIKFAEKLAKKIAKYRKDGLSANGEFGTENLVFKILRNGGYLDRLSQFRSSYWDDRFTLEELTIN
jgi:Cytidylyltransferase-like